MQRRKNESKPTTFVVKFNASFTLRHRFDELNSEYVNKEDASQEEIENQCPLVWDTLMLNGKLAWLRKWIVGVDKLIDFNQTHSDWLCQTICHHVNCMLIAHKSSVRSIRVSDEIFFRIFGRIDLKQKYVSEKISSKSVIAKILHTYLFLTFKINSGVGRVLQLNVPSNAW